MSDKIGCLGLGIWVRVSVVCLFDGYWFYLFSKQYFGGMQHHPGRPFWP